MLTSAESVSDPWFAGAVEAVLATFEYTAPLVLCAVFFWIAFQRRSRPRWLVPGIVLVGVLGGSFYIGTEWGEYEWRLSVDLAIYPPYPHRLESAFRVLVNVLLPLAPHPTEMFRIV